MNSASLPVRVRRTLPTTVLLLVALAGLALGGCTTREAVFENENPDTVWAAMKVAANAPTYNDWVMRRNDVAVFESERRIEVYRDLVRDVIAPGQPHWRDQQTYKLSISLAKEKKTELPMVVFVSRDWGIPAHVWTEADRYFGDIRGVLERPEGVIRASDLPPSASPAVQTPPASQPAPQPAAAQPGASPASATPPVAPPPAAPPPVDLPD